jgi:hypothetical protein
VLETLGDPPNNAVMIFGFDDGRDAQVGLNIGNLKGWGSTYNFFNYLGIALLVILLQKSSGLVKRCFDEILGICTHSWEKLGSLCHEFMT